MIITPKNYEEKLPKKLLPEYFYLATSFLCFINTEQMNGLVTYKIDGVNKPFELKEEVKIKKLKLKNPSFKDLIDFADKAFENDKKMIKKAKMHFYDAYDTSVEVKFLKNIYELNLIGEKVEFIKRIVCVCTDLENLERSFVGDYPCMVIPLTEISKDYENKFESWLTYFLLTK